MRYNMYQAAAIHADAGPGTSSGDAIKHLAAAADDLPQSMRPEWTELALLQLKTGNTAMYVFVLAVVLVFLVLAAQYEGWVVPLMLSEGAGAEMRKTLGVAVFSGMLGVTLFGIFLTPVFFSVIQWIKDRQGYGLPEVDGETVALGEIAVRQHEGGVTDRPHG